MGEDETAAAAPAPKAVKLRSNVRRPLQFRLGGKTVRLSPGEALEVPEAWLGSGEIQRFCSTGMLSMLDVAPAEPPTEEGAPDSAPPAGGAPDDQPPSPASAKAPSKEKTKSPKSGS